MRRAIFLVAPLALTLGGAQQQGPRFERVYPLKPSEGVFAYARISPDGRFLAYASEMPDPSRSGRIVQTVTVADLSTRKILFEEPGIDAYWSNDGQKMIFLSYKRGSSVAIRDHSTGAVTYDVAPVALGDYFSWSVRDNRDLILTIQSNYYYLDGSKAVLPHARVSSCPGIGTGDRPLISHDGLRITTFVRGTVVVRGLDNCSDIIDTGLDGAKADFSWDGRYVAFHIPKENARGYDVIVVDLRQRTLRRVTASLPGSSFFPSWTRDGRLNFRYDSEDYRGFITASNVLSAPAKPLPAEPAHVPDERSWTDIFPETPAPKTRLNLVLVWGSWGAHSAEALTELQQTRDYFGDRSTDVGVMMSTDPASFESDVQRILRQEDIRLARIPLSPERLTLTEINNQNPSTLLFMDGKLVGRKLGAKSFQELRDWVISTQVIKP